MNVTKQIHRIQVLFLLSCFLLVIMIGPGFFPQEQSDSPEEFVGAEVCGTCHETQFKVWKNSTHGKAGGAPSRDIVIAPFDGTPIRFKDAEVIPSILPDGKYVFTVRQKQRNEKTFPVDGVVGGGHMEGGGTQGFLSRFPDGTLRFLPFDYSKTGKTWFANTGTRKNAGWVPISENLSLADCGDWPPNRILGTLDRFSNCQECHGSQIQAEFVSSEKRFVTRYTTLAINCESCHGPGKRHVELAQSGRISESGDIAMRSLSTLQKDESLEVCFQCHSVKDVLAQGYKSGKPLQDFYSLRFPALGDRPLLPDGRVRTFAYQESHLFSDCYVNGSMTCVDCHDPHSQEYRDVLRRPLPSRFSDGQCTGCHSSKAESMEKHSHHQREAVRCVNCHMPYLQHPEIGAQIRFARSDHSISIPRPKFDATIGIENACSQCHRDKSVQWLDDKTKEWYGEIKPHKPIIAGLFKAKEAQEIAQAGRLVLLPHAKFPAAQFAGLSLVFEKFLRLKTPLPGSLIDSLMLFCSNEDIDIAGLATASLDLAQGHSASVKRFLEEFDDRGKNERVHKRWALALGYAGDKYLQAGMYDDAVTVYLKALTKAPRDPKIRLHIAEALSAKKNFPSAMEYYSEAIELDSLQPLAYVNLGITYAAQNNLPDAIRQYLRAIEIGPFEPLAYINLGNAYLQQGREYSAIESYSKAIELDPSLALAHIYLARAYILTKQYDRALVSVQQGLEFNPAHSSARQMLTDLQKVLNR